VSRHHAAIKNDPRWHAVRAECLDRDGHACTSCGTAAEDLERPLEADHIVRLSEDASLAFDLENLVKLCRPCHNEKERRYEETKLIRVEWISERYSELENVITNRQW
jgi:5-methylcytosine-specific restriction endonuclease McrA